MKIFGIILTVIISYCLGSISTGIIVSKINKGPDLHTVGSKSTGATNVLRTMGWKFGLITFLGDAIKAIIACIIGSCLIGNNGGLMLAGLFVILGHNWPIFFSFKGGKGVASSCGVMLATFPVPAVICFILTISLIAITKYVSVGSMFMLILFSLITSIFYSGGNLCIIIWTLLLAVLCIYRHKANISRLIKHEENRLGSKK